MEQHFFRLVQFVKIVGGFEMRRGRFVIDCQRRARIAEGECELAQLPQCLCPRSERLRFAGALPDRCVFVSEFPQRFFTYMPIHRASQAPVDL